MRLGTVSAATPAPYIISGGRATISAACGTLVGIGLARFSYTPLLPAVIGEHWFAPAASAYLGAANLAGYLAGALLARPLAARLAAPALLRGLMLLATAAFFACAFPAPLPWFSIWRLLSGIAGGGLMVLAAPSVLPHVTPQRRGAAGGAIFAGVGLGIAASGTLVPLLLRYGLTEAWLGLGALSLLLTAVAWGGWPAGNPAGQAQPARIPLTAPVRRLRALYVEYGLNAVGLVPHMIFLVDFIARGLGQRLDRGARYWVLFGLGAIAGPVLGGHIADRVGFGRTLRAAFVVQAVAVLLPALGTGTVTLIVSSLVVGALTPGIVSLVLGRIHELLPQDMAGQKSAWSAATTCFALMQAVAAYGLTFIFTRTGGDFRLLFLIGAASLVVAFAIDILMGATPRRRGA